MTKIPVSITMDENLLTAIDTVRPPVTSRSAAIEELVLRGLEAGTRGSDETHR